MRLHLISPKSGAADAPARYVARMALSPPLSIGILAAMTPADVELTVTDESVTPLDLGQPQDLVGISMMTCQAARGYHIADQYRARGAKVVVGGIHPSVMPEEAIQHADAVCVGEAEEYWGQLLDDARRGALKPRYQATVLPDPILVPPPRRDFFPKRYLMPRSIHTSRGCPRGCRFCSVHKFFGHRLRFRPLDQVIEELRPFSGQLVGFNDDNLVADRERAKSLFRALKPLKLRWGGYVDTTIGKDAELLDLARDSGCQMMHFGFESLSQANLRALGKNFAKVEGYLECVQQVQSRGISVFGSFVFGSDLDDLTVFETAVKFTEEARLMACIFLPLTPCPGTALFEQLDREGRILSRDWADYDITKVVYRPKQMTPEELQQGCLSCYQRFYSLGSVARRFRVRSLVSDMDRWMLAFNLAMCALWPSQFRTDTRWRLPQLAGGWTAELQRFFLDRVTDWMVSRLSRL